MRRKALSIQRRRNALLALLALCALIAYLAYIALPAAQARTSGFAAYYTAAYLLAYSPQEMRHAYDDAWFERQVAQTGFPGIRDRFNVQPPTMALLLWPLAGLSPEAARLAWTLLGLAFLLGGLALLMHALEWPAHWSLLAVPLCLLYAPITENLREGQAYLWLFFLLCLLFWALLRERHRLSPHPYAEALAGVSLGLMLALKTGAVWLWPLLLLAGYWRALLWAATTALLLALVSLPAMGLPTWYAYGTQLPHLATDPTRYVIAYQTTTSLIGHLLVYDAHWNPRPLANWPLLAQALTLTVLLLSLALTARWVRRGAPSIQGTALTLALFAALAVTDMPVSMGYHYVLVLPALLVACWWAWHQGPGRQAWSVLLLAALLLGAPLAYLSPRLQAGAWALLAYPRVYGAYLLWGWLGWALHQPLFIKAEA
ncbi:MAG TPA: glycosyltransferase 87 family protein [Chthonomonadaceae bacterium]|nr:glycosyltransferase 87 family protein [Chthonomonadaceae bacterium]